MQKKREPTCWKAFLFETLVFQLKDLEKTTPPKKGIIAPPGKVLKAWLLWSGWLGEDGSLLL